MHPEPSPSTPPDLPHPLGLRFTGSGSEYFRIWIVNLLLTVLTLTLYLPWAKVRRLKYFHGNTLVGDAPLGFHGQPRRMLRGYLLVGALFLLYSLAGQFSPIAGLVALALVVAVAPALFCASLQFRLANTSWRGLRFRFTGSVREAYWLTLPAVAMFGVVAGFGVLAALLEQRPGNWQVALLVLPLLLLQATAMVWLLWRIKKYQHTHYAFGALQTGFSARVGQFAGLALRTAGWSLLILVLVGALAFVLARGGSQPQQLFATMLPMLTVLLLFAVLQPYFVARLQNLVWNHTASEALRLHSALRARALVGLTLKNWLLIVVTLGLYWPFAAIATARLRLQAVSLTTRDDPAQIVGAARAASPDAAGDAAGDLFGLDLGL